MIISADIADMDDIRKWFNGKRNYLDGVALYVKYGQDEGLKKLFTKEAESAFKKQRLVSALEEILSAGRSEKSPQQKKTLEEFAVRQMNRKWLHDNGIEDAPEKRWPEQRDEILQSLWLQWKDKFGEMMNLCARVGDLSKEGLKDPNKEQEAGRMGLRILDLDDECEQLYKQRDHYKQHGKLLQDAKPVDISLDPVQWGSKLANHQRYVRRFKKDLLKDPANTEKAELLKKH